MDPFNKFKDIEKRISFSENQDAKGIEDIATLKTRTTALENTATELALQISTNKTQATADLDAAKSELIFRINTSDSDLSNEVYTIKSEVNGHWLRLSEHDKILTSNTSSIEQHTKKFEDYDVQKLITDSSLTNAWTKLYDHDDRLFMIERDIPGIVQSYLSFNQQLGDYLAAQNQLSAEIDAVDDKVFLANAEINQNKIDITTLNNEVGKINTSISSAGAVGTRLSSAETSISGLENSVTSLTTQQQLQGTTLSNLGATVTDMNTVLNAACVDINQTETNLTTTNGLIGDLSGKVSVLETDLASTNSMLSTANSNISAAHFKIDEVATDLGTAKASITNLTTGLAAANTSITDLSAQVEQLGSGSGTGGNSENASAVNLLKPKIYKTFEELAALCYNMNEPHLWSSAGIQEKRVIDSRSSIGPRGRLLARVAPNTQFKGKIRAYLTIPHITQEITDPITGEVTTVITEQLKTTTTGTFSINGVGTQQTINLLADTDYAMEFSFDFIAASAFVEFKIALNDTTFANTTLKFLEIVVEKGTNFLILSRDDSRVYDVYHFSTSARIDYVFHEPENFKWMDSYYIYLNPTFPTQDLQTLYTGDGWIRLLRLSHKFGPTILFTNPLTFFIAGDNDILYCSKDKNVNNTTVMLENVFDVYYAKYSLFNNFENTFCIVTNDYQLQVGQIAANTTSGNKKPIEPLKIGDVEFPKEFCGIYPIQVFYAALIPKNMSLGFLLQHISGHVFYIDSENPTYMMDLGIGSEPNAIVSEDWLSLDIYYRRENRIIKQTLARTVQTSQDWTLIAKKEILNDVTQVYVGDVGKQFRLTPTGWQIVNLT